MKHPIIRSLYLAVFYLETTICCASQAAWMEPESRDVETVICSEDNQFSWYNGPGKQEEWLLNFGAATRTRLKGAQDITALKFDLSSFAGRTVEEAELHLTRSNSPPIFALVAATINADWEEGRGWGSVARIGESCWRWRSRPSSPDSTKPENEWAFPHSDFSCASFGNFGSLVSYAYKADGTFGTYTSRNKTWLRMKLAPALVHSLMLDQYGLTVTDPRGYNYENPRIYTKDESRILAPRLLLRFRNELDTRPPEQVRSLQVEPGARNGEVILSFDAPEDPDAPKAFGYRVFISDSSSFQTVEEVAPWRIPRPGVPGTEQRILIENLEPGKDYFFSIQAYDHAGNHGKSITVEFPLPQVKPSFTLPIEKLGVAENQNQDVRTVPGVLRYWGCSEVTKVNPITGNRMEDAYTESGGDAYKSSNTIWNADANRISLMAARNEVIGFQLIVERLTESLTNVHVDISDLKGKEGAEIDAKRCVEPFILDYVAEDGRWYPDAAVPLSSPFPNTFSIPEPNRNPDGMNQAIWLDIYIPKSSSEGKYEGTITVTADQLESPVEIKLEVSVRPVEIPDKLSFIVDLNGYGNKWDYGNRERTRLIWFQTCQKHRLSLNTLPYGWSANITSDRGPTLAGEGANRRIQDWSVFDEAYGPLFDGSAFSPSNPVHPYIGPGANTPVSTFYTTFFESWPIHVLDPRYGFDADGKGGAYWNRLIDTEKESFWTEAPDVLNAFTTGYQEGVQSVVKEWFEHAEEKGWHDTFFQIYLNHKYYYNNCAALWILEECVTADDFRAVGFFHRLYREGWREAEAPNVNWHWRIDISNHWGQHYGQIDNLINWYVMNKSSTDWHWPHIRYRNILLDSDERWVWYGTGPSPSEPGIDHAKVFLQAWTQGLDGGLPYWDNFQTNWSEADALSVVYSGRKVPGFGQFEGPIMSIRAKMMRQAQQIVELANLLAAQPGWNRESVTSAILARYGDGSWDRSFDTLTEVDLYELKTALIAALEDSSKSNTSVDEFSMFQ